MHGHQRGNGRECAGAIAPCAGHANRSAACDEEVIEPIVEITPPPDSKIFHIHQLKPHAWQVKGTEIERVTRITNWDYYEAALRFQRILDALGIAQALRDAGVQEGDTVRIGETELVWGYDNAFGE